MVTDTITFKAWSKTECCQCGEEYQVTRTEPRTKLVIECICDECEGYNRGREDGLAESEGVILGLKIELRNIEHKVEELTDLLINKLRG